MDRRHQVGWCAKMDKSIKAGGRLEVFGVEHVVVSFLFLRDNPCADKSHASSSAAMTLARKGVGLLGLRDFEGHDAEQEVAFPIGDDALATAEQLTRQCQVIGY